MLGGSNTFLSWYIEASYMWQSEVDSNILFFLHMLMNINIIKTLKSTGFKNFFCFAVVIELVIYKK